ncbi:MAG: amidase [Rubrivivax sp.]
MQLHEYARHDALGLADLVARREVSATELARTAMRAIEALNPKLGAVVETYADRIDGLDESTLGDGPFRGVPFLMKDVFGHEAGRRIEFGSRLCAGMVAEVDSVYCTLVKASGVNIIGRSAAPEYSMAGTTETTLYGHTSTPWRQGYCAGGSTGGGAAAVASGLVPIAQGTDIAGSIRMPASFCGGVGLKPSRGRISFAPMLDENGYGLGQNFVQTKSIRDTAAMLDCLAVPQPGDPFVIPRPAGTWREGAQQAAPRPLRIGWSTAAHTGVPVDPEVAAAVQRTAQLLADMGHQVEEDTPAYDGLAAMHAMCTLWFFGFDGRLAGYARRTGRTPGPETLEPMVWKILQHARTLGSAPFMAAMAQTNTSRRQLGAVFARRDLWLTPTTPRVAEPWGLYSLCRDDVPFEGYVEQILAPVAQHTLPHNIMGTPALSLPLFMHSNGLPIGVQLAAPPAQELLLLQLGAELERALPWADRIPALHVSSA